MENILKALEEKLTELAHSKGMTEKELTDQYMEEFSEEAQYVPFMDGGFYAWRGKTGDDTREVLLKGILCEHDVIVSHPNQD